MDIINKPRPHPHPLKGGFKPLNKIQIGQIVSVTLRFSEKFVWFIYVR